MYHKVKPYYVFNAEYEIN